MASSTAQHHATKSGKTKTRTRRTRQRDPLAVMLLKQDHRTVKQLFAEHDAAGDGAHGEKKRIGEKIFDELDVHTQIEEEIYYPAARDGVGSETDLLVTEAFEEHAVAKRLICSYNVPICGNGPNGPAGGARVRASDAAVLRA